MLQIFLARRRRCTTTSAPDRSSYEVIQRCGDEGFGYGNFRALLREHRALQKAGTSPA